MKKLLALILAVIMVASIMTACADKEEIKGTIDDAQNAFEDIDNALQDAIDDLNNSLEDSESEDETEDVLAVPGNSSGGVYTNTFAGIKFTAPESWSFYTDEEIMELMEIGSDMLNDDDALAYELSMQATIYSMMAENAETGASVQIMFENLALVGALGYSADDYADSIASQLEDLTEIEYEVGEKSNKTIAGEDYVVIPTTANSMGVDMEQYYLMRKIDGYMMSMIITTVPDLGTTLDDVTSLFSAID